MQPARYQSDQVFFFLSLFSFHSGACFLIEKLTEDGFDPVEVMIGSLKRNRGAADIHPELRAGRSWSDAREKQLS